MYRKDENDVVKKVWQWDKKVKSSRGRPDQTWDAVVKKDIKRTCIKNWHTIEKSREVRSISLPLLSRETGNDDDDFDDDD